MRKSLLYLLIALFFMACTQEEPSDERPNIILVMVDDMGYSDLGFFGSRIETPHIDDLARGGTLFTQFYNTSRCCPSRAALMTGLYQHQAGVGDMTGDYGYPAYQGRLNNQCVTIAEVLKESGYHTMLVGKWHLGSGKEYWPRERGFEDFYGVPEGGGVYFYPFHRKRNVVLNDSILTLDSSYYSTYGFNEYATNFVDQASKKDQPFFLYLAHIAPHFPIQAPKDRYSKYVGRFKDGFEKLRQEKLETMKKKGILDEHISLSPGDELVAQWDSMNDDQKEFFDLKMAIYAAQLEIVDDGIGSMINTLKKNGAYENTAIFFLSDNGGTHEELGFDPMDSEDIDLLGSNETYRSYGRSWANVSNTPFRMYKHWVHEGGISSPLIFHYPNLKLHAELNHEAAHIMDIMPTCLDLAQTSYPETYRENSIIPVEGKSLMPLLEHGGREEHEGLFWEHEGNRAVRKGKWKLVSAFPENEWSLYDIEADRIETNDLSDENPELVEELKMDYERWANRVGVVDRQIILDR
jgi:arylsulfatase A-like enzyme